jgi:hypothetical protein
MSKIKSEDEKALFVLEEALSRATDSLEREKSFSPFALLLNESGESEMIENSLESPEENLALLEETIHQRVKKEDIEVLVIASESSVPQQFAHQALYAIRLHIEEKSQRERKIGARFLYVPYELLQNQEEKISLKLYPPHPVAFPAEYLL